MPVIYIIGGYLVLGAATFTIQMMNCSNPTDAEAEKYVFRSIFWPITIFNKSILIFKWFLKAFCFCIFEDK